MFCPFSSLLKIVNAKFSITFRDSEAYRHSKGSEKVQKMFHFIEHSISHKILILQKGWHHGHVTCVVT